MSISKLENDVLEIRIGLYEIMTGEKEMSEAIDYIEALRGMQLSVEVLTNTRIGLTLNDLRKKTTDEKISKKAKALIKQWRALLDETTGPSSEGSTKSQSQKSENDCETSQQPPLEEEQPPAALPGMPLSVEVLTNTRIGLTENGFRKKAADEKISKKSKKSARQTAQSGDGVDFGQAKKEEEEDSDYKPLSIWRREPGVEQKYQGWKEGDKCCAPFEGDGTWYLAKIIGFCGNGRCEVEYMIYGGTAIVNLKDLLSEKEIQSDEESDGEWAQQPKTERKTPTLADFLTYHGTITRILEQLHKKGIVYKNLRPDNILLFNPNGTNFDVTSSTQPIVKLAKTGRVPEISLFSAPEVTNEPFLFDSKADLWSCGALIYFCYTGRAPFPAPTPEALKLFYKWNFHLRPDIPEYCSPHFADLLSGVLKRYASDRFRLTSFYNHPFFVRTLPSCGLPVDGSLASDPVLPYDEDEIAEGNVDWLLGDWKREYPSEPHVRPPDDDDDEPFIGADIYEVEKIKDIKNVNGKNLYLTKWTNYGDDESTYEPVSNLLGSRQSREEAEFRFAGPRNNLLFAVKNTDRINRRRTPHTKMAEAMKIVKELRLPYNNNTKKHAHRAKERDAIRLLNIAEIRNKFK